ncbi:MAG: MmgE/PrpD family protein [Chloroflexi bacterium]|nr:MmgE/PrpD family protein [Chloroflexota bacterium]
MDAAQSFAENAANTRFEDIPAEAVRVARMDVLDTIGLALAASTLAPGCREVAELIKDGGGKEESTILGFGGKVPSWMAAFANGTQAHSLEFDDVHEVARVHAGVTVVPASLAVAERVGKVDGKSFLTAVIVGIDLACRLAMAAPITRSWHATGIYGIFGAAAAAGRILGLRADRIQHALGIAYSQAAGNAQASSDAVLTKRLQAGFAAKGGVLSALLAEKGITGAINSLEGEFGLYKVYHGGKYDREVLTSELGKRFEAANLTFKPYPSGRGTHASIDATLEIVREHDIKPEDIDTITVFKSRTAARIEGGEKKKRPTDVVDAQLNVPFTVATAAVKRRVGLRDFLPEALKDPAVLAVAQKVNVEPYPEFSPDDFHPGITEIKTRAGKVYRKRVDEPYGNPRNPIPREHLVQKFMDCASSAARPATEKNIKEVVETVMKLEEVRDVSAIIRLLA